jgi:hypothetical protein
MYRFTIAEQNVIEEEYKFFEIFLKITLDNYNGL